MIAHVGSEVFARLWVGRNTALEAVSEASYYAATQPLGTATLLAPFVLLAWMTGSLAAKKTLKSGMVLFSAGAVAISLLYFGGHMGAEQAMQHRKWTAAALSVGLLPFQSIPVLLVILVIRLLVGRKRSEKEI